MNSTYFMLFDSSKREQQSWRPGFDFFLHFPVPDSKIKRDIGAKGSDFDIAVSGASDFDALEECIDEKFYRRFESFTNSLEALEEEFRDTVDSKYK